MTSTLELTTFLLARIAEDQDRAGTVHDGSRCDLATRGAVDPMFGWTCTCSWPERVRADCGAKRRLVSRLESMRRGASDAGHEALAALRELASTWADHPEYQGEWVQ